QPGLFAQPVLSRRAPAQGLGELRPGCEEGERCGKDQLLTSAASHPTFSLLLFVRGPLPEHLAGGTGACSCFREQVGVGRRSQDALRFRSASHPCPARVNPTSVQRGAMVRRETRNPKELNPLPGEHGPWKDYAKLAP